MVTVSGALEVLFSLTINWKVSVVDAVTSGAVKVGLAAVASESVTVKPVKSVWVHV